MAVSVRARLPTRRAWRNSRSSVERTPPCWTAPPASAADLSEDLALAEDRRVEPGGDLEEVGRGGVVVLGEQVRLQVVDGHPADVARNSVTSA